MAVPKKKVSSSKRGMRRGGNGTYKVNFPNILVDETIVDDHNSYKLQKRF